MTDDPAATAPRRASPWHWLLCCAWVLLAAGPGQAGAQALSLAVAQTSLSLPVYVAEAQGFFAGEGVAVRTLDCSGGSRCLRQLLDGQVQLATASELPVVFNSFQRSDFAIVSSLAKGTNSISVIGRKSAGAVDAATLIGKKVGFSPGTSAHYFLDTFLLVHGIDPKQVQLVPLLPEQMATALAQRQIDAFAGYATWTWAARQALGADAIVLSDAHLYTETFNLVAGRSTLAGQAADVIKLLKALQRAQRFIAEQPRRAQQIMQARLKLAPGLAEMMFSDFSFRLGLEQSLVSTMEGQARWALREGHVAPGQKVPNYLQFVDAGPLRTAVPAALLP